MSKWKAGQIVTIKGVVYRVKSYKSEAPLYSSPCDGCAFACGNRCMFIVRAPKYCDCMQLIPNDCYFEKVYPKS
jgi:hypothetical protein